VLITLSFLGAGLSILGINIYLEHVSAGHTGTDKKYILYEKISIITNCGSEISVFRPFTVTMVFPDALQQN